MAALLLTVGCSDPTPPRSDLESFRSALEARDELSRASGLTAFLARLDAENLPGALELLEAHQVGVQPEEVRWFMLAWSRFDAPGAFAWAQAWPTPWRRVLMNQALYAWAHRDGAAALAAAEAEAGDDEAERGRLVASAMEGWLRGEDREAAADAIARIAEPKRRRRLTFVLAGEVHRGGAEALERWAESLPADAPNDFKQGAFYHAATILANDDPQEAARWYELHRGAPHAEGALPGIARKWAYAHDPAALYAWLLSLPPDAEVAEAISDGFRVWMNRDATAAETWLETRWEDPRLDPAIAELVLHVGKLEPERAFAWAGRLRDPDERRRRQVLIGRSWLRSDAEAARTWLARSDLPAEVRAEIEQSPLAAQPRRSAPNVAPGAAD